MLLFHNGAIYTMAPDHPTVEAVLVGDDGRIQAVGAKAVIAVPGVQMVELQGRTLIPGFNDAHVHLASLGMLLTQYVDVRVHRAPKIPAVLARLTERAEREPVGTWIQIDRLDHAGNPLGAEQAITPYEAIYAYTMGGAILSGDEANRGSITPGKWADLVVLSGDPLITPPAQMLDLVVEQTYVGGNLRYQR